MSVPVLGPPVYVANVSPLTPVYMAIIEPFRRLLVYPAMLGNLRTEWMDAYPPA